MSRKNVVLDRTSYGAIQGARWEAQDSTFPDPYSPGAALGVQNHCFGPWAQVTPSRPKKKLSKGLRTRTSGRVGWGACLRGRGNRGGHGLSRPWSRGTHLHATKTKKFINSTPQKSCKGHPAELMWSYCPVLSLFSPATDPFETPNTAYP